VEETLPKAVEDAVKNSKRKDYLNVLHTVDFIHLGDFLFALYSKKTPQDLYAKLKDVKTPDDAKALHEFIPESNWKRYFGGLVACEDLYLKSRWEKLYDLRCKVAHNALMTGKDLENVEKLIAEVKPKLLKAIDKLSTVKVPPEDAELVAESAARSVNATVGEFITCWQRFESAVTRRLASRGVPTRRVPTGQDLVRLRILEADQMEAFEDMRRLRNSIVHGPATGVPVETLQGCMAELHELVSAVEAGSYLDQLRRLSEKDRMAEVQSKIDDTMHEIIDTEAFSSAMAETNAAPWDVGECDVTDIQFDDENDTCVVRLMYNASGDQDPDKMYCGTEITGEAVAVIDSKARWFTRT
jgi:hypothetical protein